MPHASRRKVSPRGDNALAFLSPGCEEPGNPHVFCTASVSLNGHHRLSMPQAMVTSAVMDGMES
eukprot:4373436-Lingulodinium_polyedra.AAC.1